MQLFVDIAALADLPAGTQRSTMIGSSRVLLCRERDTGLVHAIEDRCPHALQPLGGGVLRGSTIQCPKHGACFDLVSGRSLNGVTDRPVKIFTVKIEQDRIYIALQPQAGSPA